MLAPRWNTRFSVGRVRSAFHPSRRDADAQVQREAAALIRARARSFYIACRFLPPRVRRDVQITYAFYRTVDDLVDEPPAGWTRADILNALQRWEDGICGRGPYPNPLCAALVRIAQRYHIPPSHLCMVIEGARFDLNMRDIETREELIWYSMQVAGSVGMVMARILGTYDEQALSAASSLGVAMQLTNVLRDVGEDLDRGRVYLPRADMERSGCSREMLSQRRVFPEFDAVMKELSQEARHFYRQGMDGIARLDPSVQFSIDLAATLYSRILDKVAESGFDTFSRRAHLSSWEKWRLAVPAYVRHRRKYHSDMGARIMGARLK